MITYRDYLIWTASHTAQHLNESIRLALDMEDEEYAIKVLEGALDISNGLGGYKSFNPERVLPRPEFTKEAE